MPPVRLQRGCLAHQVRPSLANWSLAITQTRWTCRFSLPRICNICCPCTNFADFTSDALLDLILSLLLRAACMHVIWYTMDIWWCRWIMLYFLSRHQMQLVKNLGSIHWTCYHIVVTISVLWWQYKGKNCGCKLQISLYELSHDKHLMFLTKLKPSG